jgi:hypothetical protein
MTSPNQDPKSPDFVDNRAGNTLARRLSEALNALSGHLAQPPCIDIATGYFNPQGFGILAKALERVGPIRLLLGAEPHSPPSMPVRKLGEPRGQRFEAKLVRDAWEETQQSLLHDRDRLGFAAESDRAIQKLLEFLESGRIEVRRYAKGFLHGKAYIVRDHGVIVGSSNFTAAGLVANLELNVGQYQPGPRLGVQQWFDELWAEADPYDLAALYAARFHEYEPYLIYLRVLLERYGDELEQERPASGPISLTRFQYDGLDRAFRILEAYNGVLIADSVGLGKSFVGGEIIRRVIEQERRRALLIAPATLRDGTWARFKHRFQLGVETISFQELAADEQLGGTRKVLAADKNEYSLIIVDEAHTLRNPDTTFASALRALLEGTPPKRVVLMSATPVNNSLWDLYNQLAFFIRHDGVFADKGIPNLRERFAAAVKHDPFSLKPDVLWDVLDATTVRRTRHFVQKWYPNDTIIGIDGIPVAIQFPNPNVASETYDLEDVLPGFFAEVERILAPADGSDPPLTMARYFPSRFRHDHAIEKRELALVGLIRSGLLKRFESSAHAFATTLGRMVEGHDLFLEALGRGMLLTSAQLAELADTDGDEAWDDLLADGEQLDATAVNVSALRQAVKHDRVLLESLRVRAATVSPAKDPKLHLLADALAGIAGRAKRDGVSDADVRNRQKVVVFSYFADTVHWIAERLLQVLATDHRLASYRGRLVHVTGDESRQAAVYGFAPESSEAPAGWTEDKYDILVTTDVLAEGVNLQQAANIVNFDLPWNPMRLVQRHGRIDRIGSPHRDVYITCVFPDAQLDGLLELEDRIRRKLAQAAASVGLDSEVLPGIEAVDTNFADDVAEIRKLRSGDAALFELAGEDPSAHTGEEYRQELRKALQERREELEGLPWGAGSGLAHGNARGHFFCARVDDRVVLRFVPMEPDEEIARDALTCLRTITCDPDTPRILPDDLRASVYAAWERAREDIVAEWNHSADPANTTPNVRPLFKQAAEHIRQFSPPEMTLDQRNALVESLEAPRGQRDERALRLRFRPDTHDGEHTSREIAALVKERGWQRFLPPAPLPPIQADDVQVVVWMAVEKE